MAIKGVKPGEQRQDIFRETIIWDIVPEKTALLVIDMTRCFAEEEGLFFVPEAKTKIPTINSVVDASRAQGIQIVWVVRHPYRKDGLDMAQEKDFVPALVGNPAGYCEGGYGPGMIHEAELLTLRSLFAMVCTVDGIIETLGELGNQ
jgi:hypothetical protein